MEWMCSQVATVSSVYTICGCRTCCFCHFSAQRTALSSRKTEKPSYLGATVSRLVRLFFFPIEFGLFCTNPSLQSREHDMTSSLPRQVTTFGNDLIANSGNAPRHVSRSCSIQLPSWSHTKGRRLFNRGNECQKWARPTVTWKWKKDQIVSALPAPAGAALLILCFSPPDYKNRTKLLFILS